MLLHMSVSYIKAKTQLSWFDIFNYDNEVVEKISL